MDKLHFKTRPGWEPYKTAYIFQNFIFDVFLGDHIMMVVDNDTRDTHFFILKVPFETTTVQSVIKFNVFSILGAELDKGLVEFCFFVVKNTQYINLSRTFYIHLELGIVLNLFDLCIFGLEYGFDNILKRQFQLIHVEVFES